RCATSGLGPSILLFGGFNGSYLNPLGDTWEHSVAEGAGESWFGPFSPSPSPSRRFGHAMAFYPVSGLNVLYGGQSVTQLTHSTFIPTDTWNGACGTWTGAVPAHSPGPREFQGMSTGPNGFTVVLFGGNDMAFPRPVGGSFPNGRDHNETWTWGRRVA